ncbi:MAG: hypothetical protein AAGA48_41020 [Myxococcota bacterium]
MQSKTRQLVDRVRTSRAKPKFDVSYFEALALDVERMGKTAFLEEIKTLFSPPKRTSSSTAAHPLSNDFLVARERTRFKTRRQFIDAVVSDAVRQHGEKMSLTTRERTMPKLLETYSAHLSGPALRSLLNDVAAKHAHSR